MVARIVRVWIDNDFIEFEIDQSDGMSEEEFYEKAVGYVFDTVSVEIV